MPNTSKNKKFISSIVAYAGVYICLTVMLVMVFSANLEMRLDTDWFLVTIYGLLTAMAFTYFVINDRMARRYKGRFMALGFLMFYFGWLGLILSLVFEVPLNLIMYVTGAMFMIGYIIGTMGIFHWSKSSYLDRKSLKQQTRTDELTALRNRRALAQDAADEQQFSLDSDSHLSLLIIDLDDFKLVNDELGHAVGDKILVQLSQLLIKHIRSTDKIYRWGGEEFVVLLPVTALFEAHQLANKLINKVAEYGFNVSQPEPIRLTVSIGVAQWLSNESMLKETFKRADEALYQAKSEGKNSAVAADFKNLRVIR